MSNIQEHLRYGTFFWDVGAEVVLIRLHLRFCSRQLVDMPQINCSRQLGIARYHLSGRKLLAEDETERNHQRHGRCSVDVSWLGSL